MRKPIIRTSRPPAPRFGGLRKSLRVCGVCLIMPWIATCTPHRQADDPVSGVVNPDPVARGDAPVASLTVSSIDVQMVETFPLQVSVAVQGKLPNACERLAPISEDIQGDTFRIELTSAPQAGADCAGGRPQPFAESVPLPVDGLSAGLYQVEVNGLRDSFELPVDNIVRW